MNQDDAAPATQSGLSSAAEADPQPAGEGPKPPKQGGLAHWVGKIVRPVAKAAEEAVNTPVEVGANFLHKVGYADPDFQMWYENLHGSERTGLQMGKWAEDAFGKKPEGWAGAAENMVQFGAGLFAASKALKYGSLGVQGVGVAAKAAQAFGVSEKALSLGSKVAQAEKAGFVADFAFMDKYENNFFGMVDKSPTSVQNAVQRALAADTDDSDTWNRLKNGLQGFVVGRALDKTVGVVRSLWLWRKAKKLPLGSAERAELEGQIRAVSERNQGTVRAETPTAAPAAPVAAPPAAPATTKQLKQAPVKAGARPSTAAQSFSSELDQRLGIGAQSNGEWADVALRDEAGHGGVRVAYQLDGGDAMHLKTIESLEGAGRSGIPTRAMRAITELADKHGITVTLNASPFGERALSREQLRDFYRKFGFEQAKEGEGFMVRNPGDADAGFREAGRGSNGTAAYDVGQAADGAYHFEQNGKPVGDGPRFATEGEAQSAAASVNDYVAVPTPELQNTVKTIQQRIASGANPQDVAGLIDGTVFNFHWVQSPANAKAWINAVAEAAPLGHETARQSMDETGKLAQEMFGGQTPQEALSIASEVLGAVEDLPAKVWGLRAYKHATAKYVSDLSEKLDAGMATGLDADKLRMALGTLFQLNPAVKRIGTRIGQSLNAFKGEAPLPGVQYADPVEAAGKAALGSEMTNGAAKAAGPKAPASAGVFANMSKTELQNLARNIRLSGGDPAVIDHYLRNVLGVKPPKPESPAWAAFQAVRYNSLLSGTLTHAKNTFSNFGMFLVKNAELTAQGLSNGNKEMFHQGIDQLSALWLHSLESLKVATASVAERRAVLDQQEVKEGVQELLDAMKQGTPTTGPMGWLKRLWDAPQTFLMAEDEFFKQLNYRGSVRAQALRDARQLGLPASGWADHVRGALDGAFTPNGGGINTTALEMARENTFTRDLDGLAKQGSDFIGNSKFLSFFFPFRKTPVNVFLQAAERTPGLWRMSTTMREELMGTHGPQRAAEAQAKLEMGQNLWLLATGAAASGHITGGGPKDPGKRRQLEATGWRPYAIKAGDTYVEFKALEPFSTLFGIAADATEAVQDLSREARRKDFEELAGAFLLGAAANVYNKTFLKGMKDMSDLLSGAQSAGTKVVASLGQQLVPFGSFLAQTANEDDMLRDAHTVRERVLGRIPYFSSEVEPVRTVLGKPLFKQSWAERAFWPFTISEEAGTKEQALMLDLLKGLGENVEIPLPAPTLYRGIVDLRDRNAWKRSDGKNQSPYDRLLELYGTGVGDLPPVEDALRAVVNEDHGQLENIFGPSGYKFGYWKSAQPVDGIDVTESDTRLGIVRGVLAKYKDAAYQQVLKEYPALAQKEEAIAAEKASRKQEQTQHKLDAFEAFSGSALP